MSTVEAPPLERKLVAILAADVEGYSRLMHDDEEGTLATLSSHRSIVDRLIADGRGEISGSAGDSILAQFASVVDAVRCAVAIQQALAKANARIEQRKQMVFRIGINVGDVMVKDGSIFGDGVNVASRLEAIADAGGICITRGVRDHLRDRSDYEFEDLGEHAVKNIARPVRAFRVVFDAEGTTTFLPFDLGEVAPAGPSVTLTPEGDDATELLFWQSIQASDTPAEYRAYLAKFPNGVFSEVASSRIETPPRLEPAAVDEVELAFWESVEKSGNPAMYKAYIAKYPNGNFCSLATIWLSSHAESDGLPVE